MPETFKAAVGRRVQSWRLGFLAVFVVGNAWLLPTATGWACPTELPDRVVDLFIPGVPFREELRADPAVETLVVLQHGLVRSPTCMKPLERALRAHGYDTINPGYPSITTRIEDQAAMLAQAIDAHLDARSSAGLGAYDRIAFVGHSMGGLVIRAYLGMPGAVDPWCCIFAGTPHRGAAMADMRSQGFIARLFFGRGNAPEQLLTADPLYRSLAPIRAAHVGTISGGRGDGVGYSRVIPGDDDRMVGVEEAQLPEQTDTIQLFMMHTWLAISPAAVHQVLTFLAAGAFDRDAHRTW